MQSARLGQGRDLARTSICCALRVWAADGCKARRFSHPPRELCSLPNPHAFLFLLRVWKHDGLKIKGWETDRVRRVEVGQMANFYLGLVAGMLLQALILTFLVMLRPAWFGLPASKKDENAA